MRHLLPGMWISRGGDASSVEDMGVSPNFWICETKRIVTDAVCFATKEILKMYETDDLQKRATNLQKLRSETESNRVFLDWFRFGRVLLYFQKVCSSSVWISCFSVSDRDIWIKFSIENLNIARKQSYISKEVISAHLSIIKVQFRCFLKIYLFKWSIKPLDTGMVCIPLRVFLEMRVSQWSTGRD
jgi:hypothetical protein